MCGLYSTNKCKEKRLIYNLSMGSVISFYLRRHLKPFRIVIPIGFQNVK